MSMLSNQPVICPIKLCNPDFNNRAGQGGGVGGRWRMQEESEEDWLRVNPASFIHIYDGIFELFHLFSLYVRLFWFFISPTIFKYVCCGRINRCLFNLHRKNVDCTYDVHMTYIWRTDELITSGSWRTRMWRIWNMNVALTPPAWLSHRHTQDSNITLYQLIYN